MLFPVVMYGCESWSIKTAERQRIDAFEVWCWRRLLGVPWTARRSNQSWILIGTTDAEAEIPVLWPSDARSWLIETTLMLGKIEGRMRRGHRGWDGWTASPTQWTLVRVNTESWWGTVSPGMLQSMGLQRVRHEWATERNWTAPTLFRVDRCFPSPPHQGFFKEYSLSFFLLYALFAFISF